RRRARRDVHRRRSDDRIPQLGQRGQDRPGADEGFPRRKEVLPMTDQRQLGVDLFNGTWRLIESREDDDLMIDCAHASAYHWAVAPECKPENRARSAWLLARAYAVAGRSEPALHHARRCLALCEQN